MKSYRKYLAAFFAAALTLTAFAAGASPAGSWKWTSPGRNGNGFPQTLKLELKGDQLTGTLLGFDTPRGHVPDVAISDASYTDGVVKFTITREFGERKFVQHFEGKVDGDTLKGSISMTGRDGEERTRDWSATRAHNG